MRGIILTVRHDIALLIILYVQFLLSGICTVLLVLRAVKPKDTGVEAQIVVPGVLISCLTMLSWTLFILTWYFRWHFKRQIMWVLFRRLNREQARTRMAEVVVIEAMELAGFMDEGFEV